MDSQHEQLTGSSASMRRHRDRDIGQSTSSSTRPRHSQRGVLTLQNLCVEKLMERPELLASMSAMVPEELAVRILSNAPAQLLIRVQRSNPSLRACLDPVWKRICKLDVQREYENFLAGGENRPQKGWHNFYKNVQQAREKKREEVGQRLLKMQQEEQECKQ
jgi:hypothetical protein